MFESILLVDDHAAVLEGLRNVVAARYPGAVCRTAASLSEARWILSRQPADLVVLDLSISGRSGLELVEVVLAAHPRCRVLIYSMHPENQFGAAAIRAGADGYLTKDRPISEFLHALARLETGQRYISPTLAESLAEALHSVDSPALSTREAQTLSMLAGGRAPKEIAAELGVSVKTVSTYRARILVKLNLSTTADLIRYAVMNQLDPRSPLRSANGNNSGTTYGSVHP